MDWRDIDTAPKDGTVILGIRDGEGYAYPLVWRETHGWQDPEWNGGMDPTHWCPHPAYPSGDPVDD